MDNSDPNDYNPIDQKTQEKLNHIRRNIWVGGAKGLLYGLFTSSTIFYSLQFVPSLTKYRTRNNFVASFLLGSCLGSFFYALIEGRNSALHQGQLFESTKPNYMSRLRKELTSEESFQRRHETIISLKESRDKEKPKE